MIKRLFLSSLFSFLRFLSLLTKYVGYCWINSNQEFLKRPLQIFQIIGRIIYSDYSLTLV